MADAKMPAGTSIADDNTSAGSTPATSLTNPSNTPVAKIAAGNTPAADMPAGPLGPHGYPVRFGVWDVGGMCASGHKIYNRDFPNPREPIHYISESTRHHSRVLHLDGHKGEQSSPLASIKYNWPTAKSQYLGHVETYTIMVHGNHFNPPLGQHTLAYAMDHVRCRPSTFEFALPYQDPATDELSVAVFQWRSAPVAHETFGISDPAKPAIHTDQPRPVEDTTRLKNRRGFVLVWVNNPNRRLIPPRPGVTMPLGYTKLGEEIVASCARPTGESIAQYLSMMRTPGFYFQFWGSAVDGQLGEVFTHIAVLTAIAVFYDECPYP